MKKRDSQVMRFVIGIRTEDLNSAIPTVQLYLKKEKKEKKLVRKSLHKPKESKILPYSPLLTQQTSQSLLTYNTAA